MMHQKGLLSTKAVVTRRLKILLKKMVPYRVQSDVSRVFLSKIFSTKYRLEKLEANRILRGIRGNSIKKVLVVYDTLVSPSTYGDFMEVVMLARFFSSKQIEVDFIIVDGEYRSDWNLTENEIRKRLTDFLNIAGTLLDQKGATVSLVNAVQLKNWLAASMVQGIDIPFKEAVVNRKPLYIHALNTLSMLCYKADSKFLDRFLLSWNELEKRVPFKKMKNPYITWHIRCSKWGRERNTTLEEFCEIYTRLRTIYPHHAILVVSDDVGCDRYEPIARQHNFICAFSKYYSDSLLGDGALILGSDYFFTLRGGGIGMFPILSRLPYEMVCSPSNQLSHKHERLTSWAAHDQIFRKQHFDKNIWPTLCVVNETDKG